MGEGAAAAQLLAERFQAHRAHLRAVAHRMLGSAQEADDAVQEAWLRLQRHGSTEAANLGGGVNTVVVRGAWLRLEAPGSTEVANRGGWLTTVVGRVCLDMLRRRSARREEPLEVHVPDLGGGPEPEHEAVLADSLGLALLVVLDTLTPPERLAFVLHDLFAVPFDEVAAVLDGTPAAARPRASPPRRRV